MKAIFRLLVMAAGLVLIVLALGLIVAGTQAGKVAEAALERTLSYAYETDVSIDGVTFLPRDRMMEIQGLTIHNPAPFKEGPAIAIGELDVRVDLASLWTSKPTVNEVVMHDATFYVRYEAGRGTNFSALDENARRFHSGAIKGPRPMLASREYIVNSFRSEKATLDIAANFIPLSSLRLDVAPFTLTDLGSATPVSTAQAGTLFIRSVLREAITVHGLMKPIADKLSDELERLREGGDSTTQHAETP